MSKIKTMHYVRVIRSVAGWLVKEDDLVPVMDVSTSWATKEDSDFSVFQLSDLKSEEMIRRIALRFFSCQWNCYSFYLLPLGDDLLDKLPKIEIDRSARFEVFHANIKGASFKDFKTCVSYTRQIINDHGEIQISLSKLKSYFGDMNNEEFTNYVNECIYPRKGVSPDDLKAKRERFIKLIQDTFFKAHTDACPKYCG